MEKTIAEFKVPYVQILDEHGVFDKKNSVKISDDDLKKIYESMVVTRAFDDKALKLQRQGRLGTYAPMRGQEACQIASAFALQKEVFFQLSVKMEYL